MTSGGFFINCSRWRNAKLDRSLWMRLCLSYSALWLQLNISIWPHSILNYCPAVPTPTTSAEIVGEAVEGNQFAVSCYATVIAGLPTNSVQIRYLNSFGFEISNSSSRVVVTPVIQLNETTFVRTVSLNPILTNDTGNYSCVAVVEGPYHTSGVAFLNTSLVVQRKCSCKGYIVL